MVLLGIPPSSSGQDLSVDLLALPPLLLRPVQNILRDGSLFITVRKDSRTILGADISALAV